MSTPATRSSRVWHGALALVVLVTLVAQVVLLAQGGQDANSGAADAVPFGTKVVRLFSFFTVESNVLVMLAAASLARDPRRDGPGWRVLRLDALLGIVVTGIVFGLVLAPLVHPTGGAWWTNLGFHYVSPAAALVGWLAYGPRPRITLRVQLWAVVWPVAWIAYTFVRGSITGWWPYPFLDADSLGFGPALRNTGIVVLLSVGLLAVFGVLDRRLPQRS